MDPSLKLVSAGPTESCRTDFSTHTFKLHTKDHEDELYAYAFDLGEKILPVGRMNDPSKGRYFDVVYAHRSGISVEMTSLDSDRSTRGCAILTLPGAAWGSLDASERRDLIIDVRNWPGFYRTTRWDPQITVLDPPVTINEVVRQVSAGELWARGFASQDSYERRCKDGLLVEPPTQYFGSTQSNVRLRIYDHGAKHGWQTPSLRVEAQLRKDVADQHFRRLAERCYSEADADPLFVEQEEITVKDALVQHADLRDTSQWKDRPKPRNWAQKAKTPSWYKEILDHRADPLTVAQRAELDWDKTMEALKEQYGRKLWLWSRREAACKGKSTADVLEEFVTSCGTKLKRGDDQLLADQVPRGNKQVCRDAVRKAGIYAAKLAEGYEATK